VRPAAHGLDIHKTALNVSNLASQY